MLSAVTMWGGDTRSDITTNHTNTQQRVYTQKKGTEKKIYTVTVVRRVACSSDRASHPLIRRSGAPPLCVLKYPWERYWTSNCPLWMCVCGLLEFRIYIDQVLYECVWMWPCGECVKCYEKLYIRAVHTVLEEGKEKTEFTDHFCV